MKFKISIKGDSNDLFVDDLSLAKRKFRALKKNFEADLYIKLYICGESQYFSITNKIRRGKCRKKNLV